jgi:hypothetical protein
MQFSVIFAISYHETMNQIFLAWRNFTTVIRSTLARIERICHTPLAKLVVYLAITHKFLLAARQEHFATNFSNSHEFLKPIRDIIL